MILLIFFQLLISTEVDTLKTFDLEEIHVESSHQLNIQELNLKTNLNSTDDLMTRSSQLTIIKRANFAIEPTIRGLTNDRTNITIDGMHLFGACVDRMDPVSNYIELQNLESVEVCTPQNLGSCGGNNTINFLTEKVNFEDTYKINLSSFYGSASKNFINSLKSTYSNEKFSSSLNIIYKNAADFTSGGGNVISNSGYNKYNITNDNHYKYNNNNIISSSLLVDVSSDVGYPALIMDTRKTETYFLSLKHKYQKVDKNFVKFENKIYANSIWHLMDDYSRSVEEIITRNVMPNMYMPMTGKTITAGLINDYELKTNKFSLQIYNDFYNLFSTATMDMIPLSSNNIMRLKNIADANIINNRFVTNLSFFKYNLQYGSSFGLNFQYADLLDEENKNTFLLFANSNSSKNLSFAPFINTFIKKEILETIFKLTAAYFVRNPNRLELYSYYVYNPLDDSFYTGNPDLENERQINLELNISKNYKNYKGTLNIFNYEFQNYIAGVISENQYQNEKFPQLFRDYQNTGRANIWGFEYISSVNILSRLYFDWSFRYNRAYSITLKDNLPLISPFSSNLFVKYQSDKYNFILDVIYNGRQNHISNLFLNENITNSFVVFGLRFDYQILPSINLLAGIENIFDTLYHYHTSINDLPSLGRNYYINLRYSFDWC